MNTHPCQWVIESPDPTDPDYVIEATCDLPASVLVTVKSMATHARVWLCPNHKKEHDIAFTLARVQRKNKSRR